jgi:Ca-activated chloride channel family protein
MADLLLALHFIRPHYLFLLLPVLISYLLLRRAEQNRQADKPEFLPAHLADALMLPAKAGTRLWPLNLIHSLLLLALIALAGPTWERTNNPLSGDESALVIAIDVSATMARDDVQPSRLERAKHKIMDLLAARPGAYNGLIVYAGSAHRVIPLSDDAQILSNFIDAIDHYVVPNEGKNPAAVLALAQQMLAENVTGNVPGTGSLLFFTDAVPEEFLPVARDWVATQSKSQLLVWGVGNTEDEQQSLAQLADAVDSYYQPLTVDKSDVNALQWRIRNALYVSDAATADWLEKAHWLLWPMAALLLLAFRPGSRLLVPMVLLLLLPLAQVSEVQAQESSIAEDAASEWFWLDGLLTRDQQGLIYLRMDKPEEAATRFADPMWRGLAHYRAENFDAAAASFAQVDSPDARFNQANALAHGQHYIKALRIYDKVLAEEPGHQKAKHNRTIVQALVDEIDAMSESQAAESGEAAFELGDEPQRGHGAERDDTAAVDEQYSAEQLMADEQIRAQWMEQVQPNPARFLAAKFSMQAALREADQAAEGDDAQ